MATDSVCVAVDAMRDFNTYEQRLSFVGGYFAFESVYPLTSSGNKLIFPGSYTDLSRGGRAYRLPAVAVYFSSDAVYARELGSVKEACLLGVGPRLLVEHCGERPLPQGYEPEGGVEWPSGSARSAGGERCADGARSADSASSAGADSRRYPVIIEENAGVSLRRVLQDGEPIIRLAPGYVDELPDGSVCGRDGAVLEPADSEDGRRQTAKLLFDIYSQVDNLHSRKKFHRDLKASNVCVKAFGDDPADIRATLIDLEFSTDSQDGVRVESEAYFSRLFSGGQGESCDAAEYASKTAPPTLLQQDMGYLALVVAEIENRKSVDDFSEDETAAVLSKEGGLFWRTPEGSACARRISSGDLSKLANSLGLRPVDDLRALSLNAERIARNAIKHSGYLDGLDEIRLERSADMCLEKENDRIARTIFENYIEHRRQEGKEVEYEAFDEQPEDFKESCRDQAREMRGKMEAIGCSVVALDACPASRRVGQLEGWQVEHLAELEHDRWVAERTRAGWTFAPGPKSVEEKTSPYLVLWEDLDEGIKDYDRQPVRETIGILAAAGFAVCRNE